MSASAPDLDVIERTFAKAARPDPITVKERGLVDRKLDELTCLPDDDGADARAFAEFQREAQALEDQGLRGAELAGALGGDGPPLLLRTPEELDAYFGLAACASST